MRSDRRHNRCADSSGMSSHALSAMGPTQHRHLGLALVTICAAQLMVILDASIVNVALPSIQRALDFSPANLIWVINGYTLAFGGLLLLGGRTGDLFGRRRMFMIGVGVFTGASLLGGLATNEAWLIAARILQGAGGAVAAPTALALIASTFPEGPSRNRAMGVYAAMSGAGAAIGVLLGGILTSQFGWRWVLFVNVPIGIIVIVAAPFVLSETAGRSGRLDLPGAIASAAGLTLVVYGLIHAATTSWTDQWTLLALSCGAMILVVFVLIEARSPHALMPLQLFRSRDRSTVFVIMLAIGTAIFSTFYFLTLFMQDILGFGPLRAGVSYLPFAGTIVVVAGIASRLIGRAGSKPLVMIGAALGATGLFWFAQVTPNSSYLGGVLGPMLVAATGISLCFVPLTLGAVSGVGADDQGIASALLNSGQQVGGTLGLAVLGTIAIQTTLDRLLPALAPLGPAAQGAASHLLKSGGPPPVGGTIPSAVRHEVTSALVDGYSMAFAIAAGIMVLVVVIATFGLTNAAGSTRQANALDAVPASM